MHPSSRAFSTIVAMLMTTFLLVLSMGMLHLMIQENSTSSAIYHGVVAYAGAEGALEYSLLKVKNHREGFTDAVSMTGTVDPDSAILASAPLDTTNLMVSRDVQISYTMATSGTAYTGSIDAGQSEIIPLFWDAGRPMQVLSHDPNTNTSTVTKTDTFLVSPQGAITWNIVGNDTNGNTFGLSGQGSASTTIGDNTSAAVTSGTMKYLNQKEFNIQTMTIQSFLATYTDCYLVLANPTDSPVAYTITSDNGFAYPRMEIVASGRIADYRQNVDFVDRRSRIFDVLKYSLFNK